ncbi:hypothetical protein RIR_jg23580.t1 [Rhizophagus irregularis DAOM 181602=DAOM 197198]|nr:hypothetical protein RIR_jg23580.t1 [Rhizophagus irregularis DAOM 181602=DAOM 197198]
MLETTKVSTWFWTPFRRILVFQFPSRQNFEGFSSGELPTNGKSRFDQYDIRFLQRWILIRFLNVRCDIAID